MALAEQEESTVNSKGRGKGNWKVVFVPLVHFSLQPSFLT